MSDLIKHEGSGLLSLLHTKDGKLDLPKPFEHDIFLFDTHVAGTTHIEGILELEPHLQLEDKLHFYRETDNSYDPNAIVITNASGVKIGYVPQADNVIFSRLMDAGKLLFGRISAKEVRGEWVRINIRIYLQG